MPTGYTDEIAHGITFEKFVMTCARAFGALVNMRDERLDAPIPEKFPVDDYHKKMIDETKAQIIKVRAMTRESVDAEAEAEYQTALADRAKELVRRNALRAKYDAMLARVRAWIPPTPDHEGLKAFMQSQIEDSIKWDCLVDFDEIEIQKERGEVWRIQKLIALKRDLTYHEKHNAEEIERTERRNAWVAALRTNLAELSYDAV